MVLGVSTVAVPTHFVQNGAITSDFYGIKAVLFNIDVSNEILTRAHGSKRFQYTNINFPRLAIMLFDFLVLGVSS
jgi:hypothetical protein